MPRFGAHNLSKDRGPQYNNEYTKQVMSYNKSHICTDNQRHNDKFGLPTRCKRKNCLNRWSTVIKNDETYNHQGEQQ